jgi:polyisoprenoid-binding protein YceI
MNLARCLVTLPLLAIASLVSCDKDKDPPAPTSATPSAAPSASPAKAAATVATTVGTGKVSMSLAPGSEVTFLIDAPLEKIKGRFGGTMGTIDLDSMFLSQSRGTFTVDLDGMKTSTFGDESKDASQTEHMKNWLEIGTDVDEKLRERNRYAKFTITSIAEASASNIDKIETHDMQRVVTMKVNGNLLLHGISSPKTVDIVLTFVGSPEELAFVRVATAHPFAISLKEHDIKPRDLTGKFLAGALEKVGQKIDDTVQISLDFKAAR